ncbi:transport and golgi organization 14 [Tachypleus tridentatus]|uniref:transport and golgi organization 14 n=1 Tax=Tachypleus tridentatus TaxID=6853 RepID=UPI003FD5FD29
MIFKTLLTLVHTILRIFVRLKDKFLKLYIKLANVGDLLLRWKDLPSSPIDVGLTLSFEKLPKHLGIIIKEENISYRDLAKLIVWCLTLRIPYISVYDSEGVVKKNSKKLCDETLHWKNEVFSKDSSKYKVLFNIPGVELTEINSVTTNGYSTVFETQVNLLSRENGKKEIICIARELSKKISQGALLVSDINQKTISTALQATKGIPDPELVLLFGQAHSLSGFLPWQVRLTEIMLLSSHHNLYFREFLDILEMYSCCEQRFGK